MLNVFWIKKIIALTLPAFISVISVSICLVFYKWYFALVAFALTLLITVFISNLLLKNPFTSMIEGGGVLVFEFSSTGIINPFVCQITDPYIQNKKKGVCDIFDRETVYNLAVPTLADGELVKNDDGSLVVNLSKEDFNRARFGMFHYPVLIYNSMIKSFLTKDFLSNQEKIAFAEHSILYQNQKLAELTSAVRDFGRYIVEMTKPSSGGVLNNKWLWIIVVVGIIIVGALFAPSIYNAISGSINAGASAISNAPSSGVIIPR